MPPLTHTEFSDLTLYARGKVRDIYAAGPEADAPLLLVATDRISAFDHVLATGIQDKGKILTQLSLFWFDHLKAFVPNHLITSDVAAYPASFRAHSDDLRGRSMLVKRARMFAVECVARGFVSGSAWKDYQATGGICGIPLPANLRESERLPAPIFTPAAKINTGGHDDNISFDLMVEHIGAANAEQLRTLTLAIYEKASAHAASKGLILADTKFEFGLVDDQAGNARITLADEVLTPDSSRYWLAEAYHPGGPQPSFDKQFVRDYLESIHWNKQAPAPALPDEVARRTREKYLEAFNLITGTAGLA